MKNKILTQLPKWEYGKNKGSIKWNDVVGEDINVLYQGNTYIIKVLDYNKNYLKVYYNNKEHEIYSDSFKKCNFGKILGVINYSHVFKIGDVININDEDNLTILDTIRMKQNQRGYIVKCNKCNGIYETYESSLINNVSCSVCNNRIIIKGINDIATTHPQIAKYFYNVEDTYKYSYSSGKSVIVICDKCGSKKHINIDNLYNQGFSCSVCSDGISIPEKFTNCVLNQLNLYFKTQLTKKDFKWVRNYRYDFYFEYNDESYIIETHGRQHYKDAWHKLLKTQKNDRLKKELALNNGIREENYIVIDCRKSELDWIEENILKSRLNELFDLSSIDWGKCLKFSSSSLLLESCELYNLGNTVKKISEILNMSVDTIRNWVKTGTEINLCKYDPNKDKFEAQSKVGKSKRKKVRAFFKNKIIIFESKKEAREYFGISQTIADRLTNTKLEFNLDDKNGFSKENINKYEKIIGLRLEFI